MTDPARYARDISLADAIHECREEVLDTEFSMGLTEEQANELVSEGLITCEQVVYQYELAPERTCEQMRDRIREVLGL